MSCESKSKEYLEKLDKDKILMETQFAEIENILKENENIDRETLITILNSFNTLNIQYEQLCNDIILFMTIFKVEENEIRIYQTEELIELLESKVNKIG